jgi:hypothetical protein
MLVRPSFRPSSKVSVANLRSAVNHRAKLPTSPTCVRACVRVGASNVQVRTWKDTCIQRDFVAPGTAVDVDDDDEDVEEDKESTVRPRVVFGRTDGQRFQRQ